MHYSTSYKFIKIGYEHRSFLHHCEHTLFSTETMADHITI